MSDDKPRPRRQIPRQDQQPSQPYIFTLERRDGPSGGYKAWAIAVIERGASTVAIRLKTAAGDAHRLAEKYTLEPGGAERFFAEDLPQLGRPNMEVTRNTPSVLFVFKDIEKRFKTVGIAVFRGRVDVSLEEGSTADQRVQRAADNEFRARSNDMLTTPDDDIPR